MYKSERHFGLDVEAIAKVAQAMQSGGTPPQTRVGELPPGEFSSEPSLPWDSSLEWEQPPWPETEEEAQGIWDLLRAAMVVLFVMTLVNYFTPGGW